MNFQLTKEQEFVRKMVREFATTEVEPIAADIDKEHRFPEENVEKMAKLGMMGIPFPTEYGGAGGDHIAYAICVEELARVCASTAVIVSAHTSLCCWPIFNYGTEAQKEKYLPDLLPERSSAHSDLLNPTQVQTLPDSRQELNSLTDSGSSTELSASSPTVDMQILS